MLLFFKHVAQPNNLCLEGVYFHLLRILEENVWKHSFVKKVGRDSLSVFFFALDICYKHQWVGRMVVGIYISMHASAAVVYLECIIIAGDINCRGERFDISTKKFVLYNSGQ